MDGTLECQPSAFRFPVRGLAFPDQQYRVPVKVQRGGRFVGQAGQEGHVTAGVGRQNSVVAKIHIFNGSTRTGQL